MVWYICTCLRTNKCSLSRIHSLFSLHVCTLLKSCLSNIVQLENHLKDTPLEMVHIRRRLYLFLKMEVHWRTDGTVKVNKSEVELIVKANISKLKLHARRKDDNEN